jgi:hypothetical protein
VWRIETIYIGASIFGQPTHMHRLYCVKITHTPYIQQYSHIHEKKKSILVIFTDYFTAQHELRGASLMLDSVLSTRP